MPRPPTGWLRRRSPRRAFSSSVRIGVNALYLLPGGVGGTEVYLRNLLAALVARQDRHEYVLFTNEETGDGLLPPGPRCTVAVQDVRAANRPARILWEQSALAAATQRLDVLLNPGFTAPLAARCPQVTVFHDLQHIRHPEFFRRWDLPAWRFLLWAAARRSCRVIAVSEATRQDVIAHYGLPPRRVTAVPHGVAPVYFAMSGQQRDPQHLLFVSTLHPHKNHERLVRVFARLHARYPGLRLTLAGMRGFHAEQVAAAVREHGVGEAVRLTGWISHGELLGLYEQAGVFVYPSTFEGFGMPVAEAMAAGLPIACSAIPPLLEVSGAAALHFDPHSDSEIAAALERLITDAVLREELGAAGRRRAQVFSWESAAAATLAVLEGAATSC